MLTEHVEAVPEHAVDRRSNLRPCTAQLPRQRQPLLCHVRHVLVFARTVQFVYLRVHLQPPFLLQLLALLLVPALPRRLLTRPAAVHHPPALRARPQPRPRRLRRPDPLPAPGMRARRHHIRWAHRQLLAGAELDATAPGVGIPLEEIRRWHTPSERRGRIAVRTFSLQFGRRCFSVEKIQFALIQRPTTATAAPGLSPQDVSLPVADDRLACGTTRSA